MKTTAKTPTRLYEERAAMRRMVSKLRTLETECDKREEAIFNPIPLNLDEFPPEPANRQHAWQQAGAACQQAREELEWCLKICFDNA